MLAERELPWFTLEVAKKIFELAKPEKVLEIFSDDRDAFGKKFKKFYIHKFLGIPPVLVHADLWSGNILWEKNNNNEEAKMLALVDWQNCHAGIFK